MALSCKTQGPVKTSKAVDAAYLPVGTEVSNQLNALGLSEVSLHWSPPGPQSAWQVLVASKPELLEVGIGDLWNSGKRISTDTSTVYPGPYLPSAWWTVATWDSNRVQSGQSQPENLDLSEQQSRRIALLGGTFMANMDRYGWLETALTASNPNRDLLFRNIAWPGDDVQGNARSEFGSALNTESWLPPDREEVYGLKVMKEHIKLVDPDLLLISFGSEAAFATSEKQFQDFVNGYHNLLTFVDSAQIDAVLISPHRHWTRGNNPEIEVQNSRLKRAASSIDSMARHYKHHFIDLYALLDNGDQRLSDNGIHLNDRGHQKMADVVARELGFEQEQSFELRLDTAGRVQYARQVKVDPFKPTDRGFRFTAQTDRLSTRGLLEVPANHILKIDGDIVREFENSPVITKGPDFNQMEHLRQMIIEKNRLHRFRINPLNKVYTHLFRKHEMGHLSYETDDYNRLTNEKDELIARLRLPLARRYEVELSDSWKAPRVYQDHEVPGYIPTPQIAEELESFTLAEGLQVNLFAADPMIANPISINWDHRGRAWVSTSTTYPQLKPGREPVDRIVILEDTDQDGQADKHTVFAEGLLIPHTVMPVEGGAYVSTTTELLFLADTDGDDRADERRVIYSGFGHSDVHHTIHSLRWMPWGDLHFFQSIYINSFIDTPFGPRRLNGSGIWEFRPETEALNVFSRGMVNPWGEAMDPWGQLFGTDGAGSESPYYLFPGSAHRTAVGMDRVLDGLSQGKPKNTGAEIISGNHMPEQWTGKLLSNDYRANRTVLYQLDEMNSGFSAQEVETMVHSSHRSYRPVDIKQGSDGAIYIVDWYSPIIDHGEVDFYHPARDKAHGRIWRLTAKDRRLDTHPNFARATVDQLLNTLKSTNQFNRLQANRELVRRKCSPETLKTWVTGLGTRNSRTDHYRLEALWLSVALNAPDRELLNLLINSIDHRVRAGAIRMVPRVIASSEGEQLLEQYITDKHPRVRLEAINAMRILGTSNANRLAFAAFDLPRDENLDYILWLTAGELKDQWLPGLQAGEKVLEGNPRKIVFALNAVNDEAAAQLMGDLYLQDQVHEDDRGEALYLMANKGTSRELDIVLELAADTGDTLLLEALYEAPLTNQNVPTQVDRVTTLLASEKMRIRTLAAQLSGRWQIEPNRPLLRSALTDQLRDEEERLAAGEALAHLEDLDGLGQIAREHPIMNVRGTAVASLVQFDPEQYTGLAVQYLSEADSAADAEIIFKTYLSIAEGSKLLAAELDGQQLAPEIAVAGIRLAFGAGRDLSHLVDVLTSSADLKPMGYRMDSTERKQLLDDALANEVTGNGRKIYFKPSLLCASCHKVKGEGGLLGPDLSTLGTYMTPESILESLINPNSSIKQGYETVIITKTDGSIVTGTLDRRTTQGARLREPSGRIVNIASGEIQNLEISPVSLMPPGLIGQLRYDEVVDLMTYLTQLGKEE